MVDLPKGFKVVPIASGFDTALKQFRQEKTIHVKVKETYMDGFTISNVRTKSHDFDLDKFVFVSGGVTGGLTPLLIKNLREIKRRGLNIEPALEMLSDDFFATNKTEVFNQMNGSDDPGFEDYPSGGYTVTKKSNIFGGVYPILVDSGELMDSLTDSTNTEAIHDIVGRQLVLGSRNAAAKPNATGHTGWKGKQVPVRNPVQLNPQGSSRLQRWTTVLDKYIMTGGKV